MAERAAAQRQFMQPSRRVIMVAPWLGLVPRKNSTGGKARLGGISKRGDSYLRRLLVNSAHTVLLCSKQAKIDPWLTSLLSRKPRLVAAVAVANKTARVAWSS
jgi:transposase